ncbi:MAG: hypothetical protein RR827_07490 [Oscillospiraceae bacterium]
MPDKKRDKKANMQKNAHSRMRQPQTFSDNLNMQMEQTIAAVVQAETYPRGQEENSTQEQSDEDEEEYNMPRDGKRYTQDAYTVAQNYIDRVEFRH